MRWALSIIIGLSLLLSGGYALASPDQALAAAQEFHQQNRMTILKNFRNFLSLPNYGADEENIGKNRDWLIEQLHAREFESEVWQAGGAPYIFAEKIFKKSAPTLLFYMHYDGQAVNRVAWHSDPFEPVLRTDSIENEGFDLPWDDLSPEQITPEIRLFARSVADDKAPIIALLSALDALEQSGLTPSINVKLLLDGEEELGSPSLQKILKMHAPQLSADLTLFCDGPMHQSGDRQLVFGVRGTISLDLTTYGPNRPLHSGHYGGWAPSPTDKMIRLLDSLKNNRGEVVVRGFNYGVTGVTQEEKDAINTLPNLDRTIARDLGLARTEGRGERLDLLLMEPALIVKGIDAGPVEDKARNVIRTEVKASLNIRLVPGQKLEWIKKAMETHFLSQGFEIVSDKPDHRLRLSQANLLRVTWGNGYPAYRSALNSPQAIKLKSMLDNIDGNPTLLSPTMGGSLPLYLFAENLSEQPIIIMPTANHDNNQHGPDENLRLGNLFSAIESFAVILSGYGL